MKMITLNAKPLVDQADAPDAAAAIAVAQARADNPDWTFTDDFFAQQASVLERGRIWTFTYYLGQPGGAKTAIAPEL